MRTTTYLINDIKGFKGKIPESAIKNLEGFQVYYTLQENNGLAYYLEDLNGNKININDLNGYKKMFLDECFDSFIKKREISDKYKEYITILNEPREIKQEINERYKIFMQYAEKNKIENTPLEYIKYIDNFSNEFERTTKKSVLSNQNEFDDFLKNKLLQEPEEYLEDREEQEEIL